MSDSKVDFSAPATLRKWPSVNNERVSASLGARTYMIIEGTLDECIRKFMLQPKSQRHLYEIHTVPQSDVVGAILSTEHVVELVRLKDFLTRDPWYGRPAATPQSREFNVTLTVAHITPLISLLAGVLILIVPALLNYIVAIYLIIAGVVGLNEIHHFLSWQRARK
jgi:hypothetical protein